MKKLRWRKGIALILSILMVMGTFTEWMPTALAALEPSQTAETGTSGDGAADPADPGGPTSGEETPSGPPAKQLDFQDPDNGRPNLYVDFLGDNGTYLPKGQTALVDGLSVPAAYDQSIESNPIAGDNIWSGYKQSDVPGPDGEDPIFWVGVGVDRTQVWELLHGDQGRQGITSLELGFYYNNVFIEPYVDASGDYAATLTRWNIGAKNETVDDKAKWSDAYKILHAETGLPVQMDPVTQETLKSPSLDAILQNNYNDDGSVGEHDQRPDWKMTYVSLELKDNPTTTTAVRRLAGDIYKGPTQENGSPVIPEAASGEDGPVYLMYIPFRLKHHDNLERLCLRLIRNATHFSIGVGADNTQYAAWERTTVRNPGKDLKLLTRFTGDLNIFTGEKADKDKEVSYTARLNFLNGGGAENTAVLSVLGDTGVSTVWVDGTGQHGSVIKGLQGGTGMEVKLNIQEGYKAKVWVVYTTGVNESGIVPEYPWTYTTVTDQEEYTFVMPEHDAIVYVQVEGDGITDYNLYLSEIPQPDSEDYQEGNETTITAGSVTINSFDPKVKHPNDGHANGPKKAVAANTPVSIRVDTHSDYQARVRIHNFKTGTDLQSGITVTGTEATIDATGVAVLPFGGTVSFTMAETDADVEVKYTKGVTRSAELQVWHDDPDANPANDANIAQLVYTIYNDTGEAAAGYSGQVYEKVETDGAGTVTDRDHGAVRDPSGKTPWVPKSAATISGSLGGDTGRAGRSWRVVPAPGEDADMAAGPEAVMSVLMASVTTESNLGSKLSGLDLRSAVLYEDAGGLTGLRKDLSGIPYGDGDTQEMARLLWELRTTVEKDPTLAGYVKTVPISPTDPTTAYTYLDLTPAQVQAYHLAVLELDKVRQGNLVAYRQAYTRYKEALSAWELTQKSEITQDTTKPIEPIKPQSVSSAWDANAGVRTYQDASYATAYIDDYLKYIARYYTYVTSISSASTKVPYDDLTDTVPCPTDVPAFAKVALPTAAEAVQAVKDAVTKYAWTAATLPSEPKPSNVITTRSGRQVSILLQADSAYEVRKVELLTTGGNSLGTVTPSPSYQNVYTFTMPSEDCMVWVHYALRDTRTVRLVVQDAGGIMANMATVHAYQVNEVDADPAMVAPTSVTVTNDGHQGEEKVTREIPRVPVSSTVSMEIGVDDQYTVSVSVTNGPGGATVTYTGDPDTGRYTFRTPSGDSGNPVVITVTYTRKGTAYHQAHIRIKQLGGDSSSANEAKWVINNSPDTQAVQDEVLEAAIRLAPGYYIDSSYAYGESGGYPYTLSGNGYDNGLGCLTGSGREGKTLTITMPNEELWVYLIVRKGLPPADPANTLSLIVKDESNTGDSPVDNWVKATVYKKEDDSQRVALDPIGKGSTGKGVTEYHYDQGNTALGTAILAGDRVVIDLNAVTAAGYFVAKVEVEPSYLGIAQLWKPTDIENDGRQLSFTMPAGSATVKVTFDKTDVAVVGFPTYFVYAQKVELDRNNEPATEPNNRIILANSDTIRNKFAASGYPIPEDAPNPAKVPEVTSGMGAGREGEEITMTFQVARGWYVQSVVALTGGAARDVPFEVKSGDNSGQGGQMQASLIMPAGDAWFIVNYRQCPENPDTPDDPDDFIPRPIPPEYGVTLRILDEDNKSTPKAANLLTASFANSLNAHTNTHDPITVSAEADTTTQYIHAGDHVNLSWELANGYSLAYILVGPAELGIYPTYTEGTRAGFTMPAANVTVVARVVKETSHLYQANLILRPPEGMTTADMAKVGQGTFTNGVGSLAQYPKNAVYSLLLNAGEQVDMDLFAFDGYYIDRVTVQPAYGASATLSGAFGSQRSGFTMPAADVNVNVWFKKGWPDTALYDLTLKVFDPSVDPDPTVEPTNYAFFKSADGTEFTAPDNDKVAGGQVKTLRSKVLDGGEIVVAVGQGENFFYDSTSVHITDSAGNIISWRPVAGGLAFAMPPRATTVEITFLSRKDERRPTRKATLTVEGNDGSAAVNLMRSDGALIRDGGTLDGLKVNDVLTLTTDLTGSDPKKQIMVAYAVDTATGGQLLVPMGKALNGYDPDARTAQIAVPDGPTEKPIKVYVKLADNSHGEHTDPAMRLLVSGPEGSGSATLAQQSDETNAVTVLAGAGDAIRAPSKEKLTVTMEPDADYEIKRITLTNGRGGKESFQWESLYQNPNFDPIRWNQDEGWIVNDKRQITFPMPPDGGTVTVEYAAVPKSDDPDTPITYTAQVVVNNEAAGNKATINDAKLWTKYLTQNGGGGAPAVDVNGDYMPDLQRLITARAGEWVNLKITVQAGYRIRPVVVVPQSYGIKPQLYLGDLDSQTTGFTMPAGDVTVYVTFVKDELQPYTATLVVQGPTGRKLADGKGINRASITSLRTGTKGPLDGDTLPASVQAVPVREWVMVDYTWDELLYYPKSLTVKDQAGRDVPFTQVDDHHIELPMVSRNITITITYKDGLPDIPLDPSSEPEPEGVPVFLHVIDAATGEPIDTENEGYGRLTYVVNGDTDPVTVTTTGNVTALPIEENEGDDAWGNTVFLQVPAGEMVTLTAYSNKEDNIYIQSAYVLYREGGQMISCNFTHNHKEPGSADVDEGFYGERTTEFETHLGRNDVYVYLARKDPTKPDDPNDPDDPGHDRYAATLMLKGDDTDTVSAAAIFVGEDIQNNDRKATGIKVNGSHGKVEAARGETIKVVVTPQEGYSIDYVLMTPLGIPIDPVRVGNTLSFTMPGYNVSVCVYLKRSSAKEYTATIHYSQQKLVEANPDGRNFATITYTPDGQAAVSATGDLTTVDAPPSIQIKEGSTVTLDVTLDDPYVVLAAYVLQGGRMVPLAPALEGTKEVNSVIDNALADGTATFTMPSGNVDVYVVTTDSPPEGTWYTAVLTVQDPNNSGDNTASIKREVPYGAADDLPDPSSKTVTSALPNQDFISVRQGQTVRVEVAAAAPGYIFDWPAILTHAGASSETLRPVATTFSYYVYDFTMGNCNSAVLANFKNAEAKKNPLTVVIEDPDNPGEVGEKQVENQVRVSVTDTEGKPELTVSSISPVGAYQVIPNVEERSTISITAIAHKGYKAYAHFQNGDEEPPALALTASGADSQGNTVYTAETTMPAEAAQLTVTFYKAYTATLVLEDRNTANQSTQAVMYADFPVATNFPTAGAGYIRTFRTQVNQTTSSIGVIPDLSRDTNLRVQVSPEVGGKIVAVLRTDSSGTTLIQDPDVKTDPGTGAKTYLYESLMGRSDVTITVIIDRDGEPSGPEDPKPGYIAAVTTRGLPADAGKPTIDVAPHPDPYRSGEVWTVAEEGGALTVTAPAPEGYVLSEARMKAENGDEPSITFTLDAAKKLYTWTSSTPSEMMPAANVMITLIYTKEPILTLRVRMPSEIKENYQNSTRTTVSKDVSGTLAPILTADGQYITVEKAANLQVEAKPGAAADPEGGGPTYTLYVKEILLQTDTGVKTLWENDDDSTEPVTVPLSGDALTMPESDATITVVYNLQRPEDDPFPPVLHYTAWVTVVGDDDQPENQVTSIANISDPGLYPVDSPRWACGVAETDIHPSIMRLTLTTKAGYTAVVTAWGRENTNLFVPVIQQGYTGAGTAEFHMPRKENAQDVLVTVRYYGPDETPPAASPENVTLVLVDHDNQAGNNAAATGGELGNTLATNGYDGAKADENDPLSNAYIQQDGKVEGGAELRLSANWAAGYKIVRATLSVPRTKPGEAQLLAGGVPDPDDGSYVATELPLNRYTTNAAARFNMPGEDAIITVYYENIYTVTLNVLGTENGKNEDKIDTTSQPRAVTSTGDEYIHKTGDRILELRGGESIQTDAVAGGNPNRLVGVVYESDLTGARATDADQNFRMPKANVNLYAVFETKPEKEEDYSYIAKVALDDESEPYGGGNKVEIKNNTNRNAKAGAFWTAAKAKDEVEITVSLKKGYQAVVTSALVDDPAKKPAGATNFDYYVTRTRFVVSGKTTTFSMPAGTDATVTVKFVKGYDFTLTMTDKTPITAHAANVTLKNTAAETLATLTAQWKDGGIVAGAPIPADAAPGADATTASATVTGLESGLTAATALTLGENDKSQLRVARYTPFTGTQLVPKGTDGTYSFQTPAENVTESVLFKDETATDDLLAKVALRGESDINGNAAKPITDWTDQEYTGEDGTATPLRQTTRGEVWTTTDGGHTIDLSLTVARGYQAKIKVVRDDSMWDTSGGTPVLKDEADWVFLDAKDFAFTVDPDGDKVTFDSEGVTEITVGFLPNEADTVLGGDIGKTRHFRFNMPTLVPAQGTEGTEGYVAAVPETDVTVIVEFEYAGNIPAPYDPRNDADKTPSFLDRGFIYAESRGDYAVVEVPTLFQDNTLYDTDNYGEANEDGNKPADKDVRFKFYILDQTSGTYLELEQGKEITLEPYDPDTLRTKDDPATADVNEADPYNYIKGMYTETTTTAEGETRREYVGSKFILRLLPQTSTPSAQYTALQSILDSDGSLEQVTKDGKTNYQTRLYIVAQDAAKNQSAYSQVWVRPCITIGGWVISYGPRHPLTATLHALLTEEELNKDLPVSDPNRQTVDPMNFRHYEAVPSFTDEIEPVSWGTDKWQQVIRVRSSELMGGYDKDYDPDPAKLLDNCGDPTYAIVLKKAANLTYTRVDLHLNTAESNAMYNPDTHTYTILDTINLVAGDIDEDGAVKWQDQDMMMNYLFRNAKWSRRLEAPVAPVEPGADATQAERDAYEAAKTAYDAAKADWDVSVNNPNSIPYRCDLDGDGTLAVADWNVMLNRGNYNHVISDYNWLEPIAGGRDGQTVSVLPHGLGALKEGDTPTLLSLPDLTLWTDGPAPFDPVWDVPLTQEELDALGEESYRPDSSGGDVPPEGPVLTPETPAGDDFLRPEIPAGEEIPWHEDALLPEDPRG